MSRSDESIKSDKGPVCPYCGHCYEDSESLDGHVSYWGSDDGPREFECYECEMTFKVREKVVRSWESLPMVQQVAKAT